ncbi:MAG: DUF1648 domain-containing protein [Gemmatimonadales bacterium]|nr:MAG: DUF1648 domain-containing protein [Gemmatimonadales bacterium]
MRRGAFDRPTEWRVLVFTLNRERVAMNLVHTPTFRLNSALFVAFLILSGVLWVYMPERYPVHFDLSGTPTRWAERNPGMWVLIVALFVISFGKVHLFQRFLINDPDSTLLNVPYKDHFHQLPRERKVRVLRRMNRFLGLVNTGALLIYLAVLLMIFFGAHNPESASSLVARYALYMVLALILVVPLFEIVAMRRMVRTKLREEGLMSATE